jgi:comEA protein
VSDEDRARLFQGMCMSQPKFAGDSALRSKANCAYRFSRHFPQASRSGVPRVSLLVLSCALIVFVPVQVRAGTKHAPPAHSIDLNSATVEQLQQVPGIGPSTAKAIVNFRQKSGPFQKVEDLLAIKGISKARFEKMRPYLTIGSMTQSSP